MTMDTFNFEKAFFSGVRSVRSDWSMMATKEDPEILIAWLRAVQRITDTFVAKNRDYGSKNIASGWLSGVVVRIGDKTSRLWNLVLNKHENEVDESVADTFLDLAAYGIIGYLMATDDWERSEVSQTIGLPALVSYWVKNNRISKQDIDAVMSLMIASDMLNEGFPAETIE